MNSSHLELAVSHLNAPYGEVVLVKHLRDALRAGSINVISEPVAAAVVSYAFVELEPRSIALCASEAGSDLRHADLLYRETLKNSLPCVPAWEAIVSESL